MTNQDNFTEYPSNLFVNRALKFLEQPCSVSEVRSGAHSAVFRLSSITALYYLKIADNLDTEIKKIDWLSSRLPTPKVVQRISGDYQEAVLMTAIEGEDLANLCHTLPPDVIVNRFAEALKRFHSAPTKNCPFEAYLPGETLVHGDACLPNILFHEDQLSGFVDLGDMGVGDIEVDLSAAVWSLQFNLGSGYGNAFLEAYGHGTTDDYEVERLRQLYEASPIFQR